jgi:chromosome segregation ATPase
MEAAAALAKQPNGALVADVLKSNEMSAEHQQWVMQLVETARLQSRKMVLLERELEDALRREEAAEKKIDSLERSVAQLKRQNEKAEREKAASDAATKSASENLKKLTAAKQAVEKQFVFDLKKERKERAAQAAVPAGTKSAPGKGAIEMRANAQLESVLRGLQAENRDLRSELAAVKKEVASVRKTEEVAPTQTEFKIVRPSNRDACNARLEVEMLRQQVEIKDVMLRYVCPQENAPANTIPSNNVASAIPQAAAQNDELLDFLSALSPMKNN